MKMGFRCGRLCVHFYKWKGECEVAQFPLQKLSFSKREPPLWFVPNPTKKVHRHTSSLWEPYSRAGMMVNVLACSISGWWISASHQFAIASLLSLVIIDLLLLLMWIFRRDGPSQEPVRDWLWSRLSLDTLARRLSVSSDWGFLSLKVLKLALRKAKKSAAVQQGWVWRALFFHMEYKASAIYSLVSFVLVLSVCLGWKDFTHGV